MYDQTLWEEQGKVKLKLLYFTCFSPCLSDDEYFTILLLRSQSFNFSIYKAKKIEVKKNRWGDDTFRKNDVFSVTVMKLKKIKCVFGF